MKNLKEVKTNPFLVMKEFEIVENPLERFTIKTEVINGYGRCRSCDCRGYISKHDGSHECKNCGHHYDRHWD